MMTKGEIRKARKEAGAAGQTWDIETAEGGGMEIVHTRTPQEESRHCARMERWARYNYECDRD